MQDAIIASNATVPSTITLGEGAVLRNFGGMSAVRVTDQAKLVMEPGSVIEDDSAVITTARKATLTRRMRRSAPPARSGCRVADFEMENGAEIQERKRPRGLRGWR